MSTRNRTTSKAKLLKQDEVRLDALAKKIASKLDGNYHEYEVYDVLYHLGESICDLLKEGNNVRIPNLGLLVFRQNSPKDYFNVTDSKYWHSNATFTPKLIFPKRVKEALARATKTRQITEGKIDPDFLLKVQPERPVLPPRVEDDFEEDFLPDKSYTVCKPAKGN